MTIREAGKDKVTASRKPASYRIGFNGGDETELEANCLDDLEELWESLYPEFECAEDGVDYVERV